MRIFLRNTPEHELLHHYFALRQAVLFNHKLRGFIGSFVKSIYLHKKKKKAKEGVLIWFYSSAVFFFSLSAHFSSLPDPAPFVSPA